MPAPPRQALLVFKIACQKESPLDYNIDYFLEACLKIKSNDSN